MTTRELVACLAVQLGLTVALPTANAAEYSERFSLSFGALQPDGPAPLGTFVALNYGGRITETLRIGAEAAWYRRSYDASFLLVDDPGAAPGSAERGITFDSVATVQTVLVMATADHYFPVRSGNLELYIGGGVGADFFRIAHFPNANLRDFTRSERALGYMVRVGLSNRTGGGIGAMFFEMFYKGSSVGEGGELVPGRGSDLDSRSAGPGFRVGFRF